LLSAPETTDASQEHSPSTCWTLRSALSENAKRRSLPTHVAKVAGLILPSTLAPILLDWTAELRNTPYQLSVNHSAELPALALIPPLLLPEQLLLNQNQTQTLNQILKHHLNPMPEQPP